MSQISLTEAVNIVSLIRKAIGEKNNDRSRVSTIKFVKGEIYTTTLDVDSLTAEIASLEEDLISITEAINMANIKNIVEFQIDGRNLTISEALSRAQLWRSQLQNLKNLTSTASATPKLESDYRGGQYYEIANFNVEAYKKIVSGLEKKVNRLSTSIDKANAIATIEFANVEKYLG